MIYNSTNFDYCIGLSSSRYVKSFCDENSLSFVLRGVDVLIDKRDGSVVNPNDSFSEHINKKYLSKEANSFFSHFFFAGEVTFTFNKCSIFYEGYVNSFVDMLSELVSSENVRRPHLFRFGFSYNSFYDEFEIESDSDIVKVELDLNEFYHDLANPISRLQDSMSDYFLLKKLKLRKK